MNKNKLWTGIGVAMLVFICLVLLIFYVVLSWQVLSIWIPAFMPK